MFIKHDYPSNNIYHHGGHAQDTGLFSTVNFHNIIPCGNREVQRDFQIHEYNTMERAQP